MVDVARARLARRGPRDSGRGAVRRGRRDQAHLLRSADHRRMPPARDLVRRPPLIESHGRPSHPPGPMCIFRVTTRYTNNRRNLGTYTTRFVWGLTGTPMTSSVEDLEVRPNNRRIIAESGARDWFERSFVIRVGPRQPDRSVEQWRPPPRLGPEGRQVRAGDQAARLDDTAHEEPAHRRRGEGDRTE